LALPSLAVCVAAASGAALVQPGGAWADGTNAVASASSEEALKEASSLVRFGLVEESKGQWDKAVRYYDKAVGSAPDYALGYVNRANVRVIFGKLDAALKDYDTAVSCCSKTRVCMCFCGG
jgi:tetratricopeptide (TPR) repeat protein